LYLPTSLRSILNQSLAQVIRAKTLKESASPRTLERYSGVLIQYQEAFGNDVPVTAFLSSVRSGFSFVGTSGSPSALRGNRKPFARGRILKIAEFLGKDPDPLLAAAVHERGVIEYDITTATALEAKVVGGLVTGLAR